MADATTVQISTSNVSNVSQVINTTVLSQSSGTINIPSLSLATTVTDVARSGVVGVSNLAARADHVHSAANLLVDGGNY
jgi:hypothetical protein